VGGGAKRTGENIFELKIKEVRKGWGKLHN
jgi:hypothetical protein